MVAELVRASRSIVLTLLDREFTSELSHFCFQLLIGFVSVNVWARINRIGQVVWWSNSTASMHNQAVLCVYVAGQGLGGKTPW